MNDIVIVLDNSNYKSDYAEDVPFKAKVLTEYKKEVIVRSIATNKKYALYYWQILEALTIKEIKNLLNMEKFGEEI